jgi:hypothetical protein
LDRDCCTCDIADVEVGLWKRKRRCGEWGVAAATWAKASNKATTPSDVASNQAKHLYRSRTSAASKMDKAEESTFDLS